MIETSGNDKFRRTLIRVMVSHGYEPWKDNSDWVSCSDIMSETMGYSVSSSQARGQYRRLVGWLEDNDISIKEYVKDVMSSGTVDEETRISIEREEENAFDKLVESTGIDTDTFQVKKGSVWGSMTNLSASFQFERRALPKEDQVERLLKLLEGREPKEFPAPKYVGEDHIALASIYDLHLERASIDGTGMESAEERFREAVQEFGMALKMLPAKEIVFLVGNDFSNIDNPRGETTKGTRQENSVHWRLGVDKQCELLTYAVDYFLNFSPVRVVVVPGNHDHYSNFWLGKYAEAYYKYAENVTIDNNRESTRRFYSFGENAFMFMHGNEEVKSTIPSLFAKEAPDAMFYKCSNLEVHTGHIHTRKESYQLITEEHGIIIREHPSLSSPSDWESLRGFTENNRAGIISFYHKDGKISSDWYIKV